MAFALTLFTFIFFSLTNANALISFEDATFPELATSGRALAMGNAYIGKVDDSSSTFYNPSGLGTVRNKHFHLSNLYLETNKGAVDLGAGGNISAVGTGIGKSFGLDGTRQLLLTNRGKTSSSRVQVMPNFTARFFSIGYFLSRRTKATMGLQTNAKFEYAYRLDHGPYASLNISLFGGVFKFGASGALVKRNEAIGEIARTASFVLDDDNTNKGHMLYITAGGKMTLPIAFLPTFSAVIHNFSSGAFSHDGGPAAPAIVPKSMDVGFSLSPKIAKNSILHIEYNYKDFGGAFASVGTSRKSMLGMEFDFGRLFFIRFGYGDGFGSGGLGIKTQKMEVDLTTYAVDRTANEFRGKEDRRFSLNISSGF